MGAGPFARFIWEVREGNLKLLFGSVGGVGVGVGARIEAG